MGKMEGHILNFYEDLDMSFRDLMRVSKRLINNRVSPVEEKMDGQNLTFTVTEDGTLKIFGKRLDEKILETRGSTWETIEENYSEITREAFKSAYFVLRDHLSHFSQESLDAVFHKGRVVIESAMMTPMTPVTIKYSSNHIRFIRAFSPYEIDTQSRAYQNDFKKITEKNLFYSDHSSRIWSVGPVPSLRNIADKSKRSKSENYVREGVMSLINQFGSNLTLESRLRDYATLSMAKYIKKNHPSIPEEIVPRVAKRITENGKKSFTVKHIKELFPESYREIWAEIREIEKYETLVLADAIIDLEKLIQRIGSIIFDCLRFQLATDFGQIATLKREVRAVKKAHSKGKVRVFNSSTGEIYDLTPAWQKKLDVAIRRSESLNLLVKPVEGIVFQTPRGRRKLTGMFTAIHRLLGLFKFYTKNERLTVV